MRGEFGVRLYRVSEERGRAVAMMAASDVLTMGARHVPTVLS